AWAANELSRAGVLTTTLEALASFADLQIPRDRDASAAVALWHLARQAQKLAPQERYEQLRNWTLPAKGRLAVRVVASFDSGQPIPQIFLGPSDPPYEPEPRFKPLSNLTLLIDAAKEAGKLDELWPAMVPLAGEGVDRGEALAAINSLVKGDAAAGPVAAGTLARVEALAALVLI